MEWLLKNHIAKPIDYNIFSVLHVSINKEYRRYVLNRIFIFLIVVFTIPISVQASDTNQSYWAAQHLSDAEKSGWLIGDVNNGESLVKRADFVKMVQDALLITPNGSFAKTTTIITPSGTDGEGHQPIIFVDTADTELQKSGFLQIALDFGLIRSEDYDDNQFKPTENLKRREAIIIVTRAIGSVYGATNKTFNPGFADYNIIPEWAQSFIGETADKKILIGYPDNEVKAEQDITLAEAAAIVMRASALTLQNRNSEYKMVVVDGFSELRSEVEVELAVPIQVIGGILYAPVKSIYVANYALHNKFTFGNEIKWLSDRQVILIQYGKGDKAFQSGNKYASNLFEPPYRDMVSQLQLEYPARIQQGEIMIPIYDVQNNKPVEGEGGYYVAKDARYNPETKTFYVVPGNPGSVGS